MYDPFAPPPMAPPPQAPVVASPPTPPVMYPGGNPSGAPLQGPNPNNALGAFGHTPNGIMAPMQWRQALMSWRQQRPMFSFNPANPAAAQQSWKTALQSWRQQRPARGSFLGAPTGVMPTNPVG